MKVENKMHDVKERIKLLIILIDSVREHKINSSRSKNWEKQLNDIYVKFENNDKYKEFINEVKNNGMERNN
jgi:hypothetical protein